LQRLRERNEEPCIGGARAKEVRNDEGRRKIFGAERKGRVRGGDVPSQPG